MAINSQGWPGSRTILDPAREPRSQMASPDTYAVTYAHLAVDRQSYGNAQVNWETNNIIQQLGVRPEAEAKVVWLVPAGELVTSAGVEVMPVSKSWEGLPVGYADVRSRKANIVKFDYQEVPNLTNLVPAPPYAADVLFAIVPRSRAIDLRSDERPNENGRGAYRGFKRLTSESAAAASNLAGIKVQTLAQGDDLILPYGPGQYLWDLSVDGLFATYVLVGTLVDREPTLVNVGSGKDVVIGGYGKDYFGAYGFREIQELRKKARRDEYSLHSDPTKMANGSKLFVGGSYRDFLIGGSEQDYFAGDRFNGYELYIPADALGGLPAPSFEKHFANLRRYQPTYFTDSQSRGSDRSSSAAIGLQSSLSVLGSDVIFSYGGKDIVYGDDNTIFGTSGGGFDLVDFRKYIDNVTVGQKDAGAYSRDQWLTKKLAGDFLDAGDGNDQIFAGIGGDAIIGGLGSDVVYIGDQIIAPDYDPFWGTKVVYGDSVAGGVKAPDYFFVGELLETEAQIAGRTSAATGGSLQVVEQKSGFQKLADVWESASKFIYLIPTIGSYVVSIVDAVKEVYTLLSPEAPAKLDAVPQAADSLVVIKDFDASDQLSLRVPQGGIWEVEYKENWGAVVGDNRNPLIGSPSGSGTMIKISGQNTPGTMFNRVFLQGYRDGLVSLAQNTNDGVIVYGGADYYLRDAATKSLVFSELIARDTASNAGLPPLAPADVLNPFG